MLHAKPQPFFARETLRLPRRTSVGYAAGAGALVLVLATPLTAASPGFSPAPAQNAAGAAAVPARNWAVDCASNEVLVVEHPGSYLRFRMHEVNEKGDQLRDQIETPEGSVARLIQRDGRPLTPEEDAGERNRLNELLSTPSAFSHHIKNEQANKKLGVDLLKMMPDAMLWSYAPGQPQPPDEAGTRPAGPPLVALDFAPNPKWSPPTIPADVLTGLKGRIWIDPRTRRMVRLDADLFHAVNVGWGVLAHIYPGGKVMLHQTAVQTTTGDQRFIVDHIEEQLAVRALLVKTVKQRLAYETSGFQPVSPMTYQQAIKILLDTPLPGR